jgi:chromosome segregation ATPase
MYCRAVKAKRAQTELEELVTELRAELKESGKKNAGLQHAVEGLNKEIEDLHGIIGNHKIEINRLESILEKVKAKKGTLTFDSLHSGGILKKMSRTSHTLLLWS